MNNLLRKKVQIGPYRKPGEPRADYLKRSAIYWGFWASLLMVLVVLLQAIFPGDLTSVDEYPIVHYVFMTLGFVFGILVMVAIFSFAASVVFRYIDG